MSNLPTETPAQGAPAVSPPPPTVSVTAATPEKPASPPSEKPEAAKPVVFHTTQPSAMPTMDPLNFENKPRDEQGLRDWTYSLTDCCGESVSECCFANCCPGMAYANIKSRIKALDQTGRPHPTGGDNLNGDCANYCFGGLAFQYIQRQEIRRRYKIRGSDSNDVLTSWCCRPCDLLQQSRELKLEENAVSLSEVESKGASVAVGLS